MARTALVAVPPALVVLWGWLRLERGPHDAGPALLVTLLALLPGLVPRRRLAAAAAAAVVALPFAALGQPFDRHFRFVPTGVRLFGHGVERFYAVTLPFGPDERAMQAVVLASLFVFVLALSLAVAGRRTGIALAVLLVGAGWPATLLNGHELARGAAILGAGLWLLAGLHATRLRPLAAGAVVVAAAAALSTASGVARGAFLHWQSWGAPRAGPVGVAYVWRSDYTGLRWPRHATQVLRVTGPARGLYWRAATLDVYRDGHWLEQTIPLERLRDDPLLPKRALADRHPVLQRVEVLGLRDTHLPAAGTPLRYATSLPVSYSWGGVAHVAGLSSGLRYDVWSYAPDPSPAQLAAAGTRYPRSISPYLSLNDRLDVAPAFGTADRRAEMLQLFAGMPDGSSYRRLYEKALAVTGHARTPYAAAVALESWFRDSGGFTYDDHPPVAKNRPELVDFVLRTKEGYCQHFAGAMALMLRDLGIPARVAVGFTSGSYDASNRSWTVTDHDAHAWVEVWFPGWGWLPFDPTPGRGELAGRYSSSSASFDAKAAAAVLPRSSAAATDLARRARANPAIIGERPTSRGGGPLRPIGGSRSIPVLLLLLAAAAAALVLYALGKRALRRARLTRARDPRALALACRRELLGYLLDQGLELPRGATLAEAVPLLRAQLGVDASAFAGAAAAAAYAPPDRSAAAAAALRRELRLLLHALARQLPLSRRLRGALSPRSLEFGRGRSAADLTRPVH